jgi:hypothetical protein
LYKFYFKTTVNTLQYVSDHIIRYRDIGGSLDGQAEGEVTCGCAENGGESAQGITGSINHMVPQR